MAEPDDLPTPEQIAIRPLDSLMSRAAFSCSKDVLNQYFTGSSSQPRTLTHDLKKRATVAHVMLHRETNEILGFFTLSSYSIPRSDFPPNIQRGQTQDVSTTLLGRMAVCSRLEGKGYGKRLLMAALSTVYAASLAVGSTAVVVDAKDEDLVAFYKKYKFTQLSNPNMPFRLFLPMATVAEMLGISH